MSYLSVMSKKSKKHIQITKIVLQWCQFAHPPPHPPQLQDYLKPAFINVYNSSVDLNLHCTCQRPCSWSKLQTSNNSGFTDSHFIYYYYCIIMVVKTTLWDHHEKESGLQWGGWSLVRTSRIMWKYGRAQLKGERKWWLLRWGGC